MKVFFVASLYHPYNGGAERILQIVAEGVVKAGHEAVVVSLRKERGRSSRDVNGVKAYYLGIKNLYWPFDSYRPASPVRATWAAIDIYNAFAGHAVGEILDREQPTIVNTHILAGLSAAVWWEVKRRHIPLIHALHDYWIICGRSTMYNRGAVCKTPCLMCRAFTAPRRHLSRRIDAVISDGNFLLQKHRELGIFSDNQPSRWVHNASNIEVGVPPKRLARVGPLRLGYLGRVEPYKGVELLLESLSEIPDGWELQIAGGGRQPYEQQFRERYGSNKVKFMGFVPPKELFANIEVLVVPSFWNDPLPTVIFEAYAHGIPVIGSSRGGIPELIEDGKTGFIFDHDVPGSFASAIRRFMEDSELAASMQPRILDKVRQYTPQRLAEKYLALYTQVLDAH